MSYLGSLTLDQYSRMTEAPVLLIRGVTGSGKTTIMREYLDNLIFDNSDSDIEMYIYDFKGGYEYNYDGLPFIKSSDSIEDIGGILDAVESEVSRRIELMHEYQVSRISALPYGSRVPLLVLVLEEYIGTVDEVNANQLQRILKLARSARVQVIFGTQSARDNEIPLSILSNVTLKVRTQSPPLPRVVLE